MLSYLPLQKSLSLIWKNLNFLTLIRTGSIDHKNTHVNDFIYIFLNILLKFMIYHMLWIYLFTPKYGSFKQKYERTNATNLYNLYQPGMWTFYALYRVDPPSPMCVWNKCVLFRLSTVKITNQSNVSALLRHRSKRMQEFGMSKDE